MLLILPYDRNCVPWQITKKYNGCNSLSKSWSKLAPELIKYLDYKADIAKCIYNCFSKFWRHLHHIHYRLIDHHHHQIFDVTFIIANKKRPIFPYLLIYVVHVSNGKSELKFLMFQIILQFNNKLSKMGHLMRSSHVQIEKCITRHICVQLLVEKH